MKKTPLFTRQRGLIALGVLLAVGGLWLGTRPRPAPVSQERAGQTVTQPAARAEWDTERPLRILPVLAEKPSKEELGKEALKRATENPDEAVVWAQSLAEPGDRETALLAVASFIILTATALTWRSLRGRLPGRTAIALPAMLPRIRQSPITFIRHLPFALFLLGLPFFCLALADPYESLSAQQVSHPGRRIAVIMDASLSMLSPFSGQQLKTQSDTAFSNTMAAAEYFVRMRMKGKYRDLIALEQFGNEAYVITPFTTDYENLLLSLKMISDVNEWQRFPDQGTIIMKAIDNGVDLFKAFDFLKSSGERFESPARGESSLPAFEFSNGFVAIHASNATLASPRNRSE